MGIEFKEAHCGNGIQDALDGKGPRGQGGGKEAGVAAQLPPSPEYQRGVLVVGRGQGFQRRSAVGDSSGWPWFHDSLADGRLFLLPKMIGSGVQY